VVEVGTAPSRLRQLPVEFKSRVVRPGQGDQYRLVPAWSSSPYRNLCSCSRSIFLEVGGRTRNVQFDIRHPSSRPARVTPCCQCIIPKMSYRLGLRRSHTARVEFQTFKTAECPTTRATAGVQYESSVKSLSISVACIRGFFRRRAEISPDLILEISTLETVIETRITYKFQFIVPKGTVQRASTPQ